MIGSRTWTCRSASPRSRLNTEEQSRKNHGTPECCATALSRHEQAWYASLVLNDSGHGEWTSMAVQRCRVLECACWRKATAGINSENAEFECMVRGSI